MNLFWCSAPGHLDVGMSTSHGLVVVTLQSYVGMSSQGLWLASRQAAHWNPRGVSRGHLFGSVHILLLYITMELAVVHSIW